MKTIAWKCDVCGYVHEGPAAPETCPVCGVGAEYFSQMELEVADPAAASISAGAAAASPSTGTAADDARLLIVGAGIAALSAAEQARRVAPALPITIVSKESGFPYYRLNLSRYVAGEVGAAGLSLRDTAWFAGQRIELLAGEAAGVVRAQRRLELRDGRVIPYERLILANGAHPFFPPIPGIALQGVLSLRTLADADRIIALALEPGRPRRCACIGGGLLGLETAGALVRRGVAVSLIETEDRLLPRQLSPAAAELLAAHVKSLGIEVYCGVKVEAIVGDERAAGVRLAGGRELDADLIVVAAGVRPSCLLARRSGLSVGRGVIVDDRMATSDAAIYAAGDVAEHRGVLYGIWPASQAQGQVAGINAAGGDARFEGLPPAHRLKVLDIDLFSVGAVFPPDDSYHVTELQPRPGAHRRLVLRAGRLVGAVLYGDCALANPLRDVIAAGTPIEKWPEQVRAALTELPAAMSVPV